MFFRNVGMSPHDVINQKNNVNKPKLFVVFKFPVTNKRYTANNVAKCNVVRIHYCLCAIRMDFQNSFFTSALIVRVAIYYS